MNSDVEKQLVASCRDGDKSAYTGLVKAYSGCIFAICLGMLGNTDDAEDIVQQALLKGFTDINQLRDDEQFGAWLSRIAKNLCIDFIRRQRRKQSILFQQSYQHQSCSKEYHELETALAKLPQDYRVALMLYYFNGQNTEKIAEALEISRAAVHARLSRARKQLRKLLKSEGCA